MSQSSNIFFSVIIPLYNEEKWLDRSVTSVLNQSFKDFELILVDDGSTDKSASMCDAFAKNNNNVRVVHKNNEGLVAARKTGIFKARADYIVYVDADDILEPNALEDIYAKLEFSKEIDMLIYSYKRIKNNGIFEVPLMYTKDFKKIEEGLYDKKRLKQEIYPLIFLFENFTFCVGRCCFRTSLLRKHYCQDNSIVGAEDYCCFSVCLVNANYVYFLNKPLYLYNRINVDSISGNIKLTLRANVAILDYILKRIYGEIDVVDSTFNMCVFDGYFGTVLRKGYDVGKQEGDRLYIKRKPHIKRASIKMIYDVFRKLPHPNCSDIVKLLNLKKTENLSIRFFLWLIKHKFYFTTICIIKIYITFCKRFVK